MNHGNTNYNPLYAESMCVCVFVGSMCYPNLVPIERDGAGNTEHMQKNKNTKSVHKKLITASVERAAKHI